MIWLALVVAAYLLGSISFSLLLARRFGGVDVREHGSGNAGASNVLRTVGKGPAAAVLLLDVAKGLLPVQTARALDAPGEVLGAVALAAVVGHVLPVFHGWRGGKGVATATGALSSLAPVAAGLAALAFLVTVAMTRYVALGSVVAVTGFPALLYLCGLLDWTPLPPVWLLSTASLIAILIVAKHRDNFRRIRAGTENRLGDPGSRKKVA